MQTNCKPVIYYFQTDCKHFANTVQTFDSESDRRCHPDLPRPLAVGRGFERLWRPVRCQIYCPSSVVFGRPRREPSHSSCPGPLVCSIAADWIRCPVSSPVLAQFCHVRKFIIASWTYEVKLAGSLRPNFKFGLRGLRVNQTLRVGLRAGACTGFGPAPGLTRQGMPVSRHAWLVDVCWVRDISRRFYCDCLFEYPLQVCRSLPSSLKR
jgi:hypothetical protein